MKNVFNEIDEVIHQKVRLGIMTFLAANGEAEFTDLKKELGLTDGNLSSHVTMLEKSDFIMITKAFAGKRPKTTIAITKKGRQALGSYLETLRKIIGT